VLQYILLPKALRPSWVIRITARHDRIFFASVRASGPYKLAFDLLGTGAINAF